MEILTQEQLQKIEEWSSDETVVSILVDSPETRIQAARGLVDKMNFSIGEKPGFLRNPKGKLAVFVDLNDKDGLHSSAKMISGNFFAKVGMAVLEAASPDGILGRNKRVRETFVNSKEMRWGNVDDVMNSLQLVLKEAKLEEIMIVCPEMELLQPDSFPKVINAFISKEKSNISLRGGSSVVRNDVSKEAKFWK